MKTFTSNHSEILLCIFGSDPCEISLPPAYVERREGNSFTLLVCPQGGGGSVQPEGRGSGPADEGGGGSGPAGRGGWVRSSRWGGGSGPADGGVRSSWLGRGGQVQPVGGGQVQPGGGGSVSRGGSASCALLRAVCLLRSRRRTFLF